MTFSVSATGGSLSYQWSKDGVAITGAGSSSYTIRSVASTDAGTYSVVVTNTVDGVTYAATSSNATLTVTQTGSGTVTVS